MRQNVDGIAFIASETAVSGAERDIRAGKDGGAAFCRFRSKHGTFAGRQGLFIGNPGLKKYLMCVTDGWPTVAHMNSYILEADRVTGPWRLVIYMKHFGEQAYFLNFPSKFISKDGRTLWLCYSANFSQGWNDVRLKFNPPGDRYGLCLHELRLLAPGEMPDTAGKGVEISFDAKTIDSLKFTVTSVKPDSPNIGLAEIAVFHWPFQYVAAIPITNREIL